MKPIHPAVLGSFADKWRRQAEGEQPRRIDLEPCAVCGVNAQPAVRLGPTTRHPEAPVCAGCLVFVLEAAIDAAQAGFPGPKTSRRHHRKVNLPA